MDEFSKRLKELRKEKNMTLIKLETETGISKSSISAWEKGETIPNAQAIITLAKFFQVTSDYLLGLSDI